MRTTPLASRRRRLLLTATATTALTTLAACGGGGGDDDEAAEERPQAAPVITTKPDEGPAAVVGVDAVETATIQIVAEGSFVDPEIGEVSGAGAGSGFIIDPSGIAVTNNHVVTGAGSLQVFVSGQERPVNAQILGVSECSDLAVIDLDGEGYPYLQWYDGDVSTGVEVFAAGFPLGDPEFTLTRGIVSKASADGETNWASVDQSVEHDAAIQPGNSGGPLVTTDGRVLGINYAGGSPTNTEQFFAIHNEEARDVIDVLRGGEDVTSLGVNGSAVVSEDGSISGVWVAGVDPGSEADRAGVQGGDIITSLQGVRLAEDGTMADYCDVLRTRTGDEALSVEVLRFSTLEVLEGEINGPALETVAILDGGGSSGSSSGGEVSGELVEVTDDTGSISVSVPAEWADITTEPQPIAGADGVATVVAAPDAAAFNATWDAPGVLVAASPALSPDPEALLDTLTPAGCTSQGRQALDSGGVTGVLEGWSCESGGTIVTMAGTTGGTNLLVLLQAPAGLPGEVAQAILGSLSIA